MAYYVYMLLCSDGSVYTGHTDELQARLAAHQMRTYSGYTSKRLPVRLIYQERFATRQEAFTAERQLKGWSREKKLALARGDWEGLVKLSRRRTP